MANNPNHYSPESEMPAFSNVWIYICDILNNIAMGKKKYILKYIVER